jgi:hypothetical protein
MKKFLLILCCLFIAVFVIKQFIPNDVPSNISEIYDYCKDNGYSMEYCFLTDFSKPSGIKRFYIYSFKENKIVDKSLCAHGLGKCDNVFETIYKTFKTTFKPTFSNEKGSCYSSLGKYKVGWLTQMSKSYFKEGYILYGLDSTNSNAKEREILIHRGNLGFETFPLPCLPVSKGCFAVSNSMMEHIKDIKKQSDKPILLYAYK